MIEKALEPSIYSRFLLRDSRDKTLVQVFIQIDEPPADMAFDVSLRSSDRVWRVGPMAWRKGDIRWWAHNVDLPEAVSQVDLVFTPSARAGMILSRFPTYPIQRPASIWSGDPIIGPNVKVRSQDTSMIKQKPPSNEEAREHLIDALAPSSELAVQVAKGMTIGEMRKGLEMRAALPSPGPDTFYELGCLLIAEGQLDDAMNELIKSRGAPELTERLQHELRYICARWLNEADEGDPAAMHLLGRAYEVGNGVGRSMSQAKYWLQKAANTGHAKATERLAALNHGEKPADDTLPKAMEKYRAQTATWHRQSATPYREWVERRRRKSYQTRGFDGHPVDLKLVMTSFADEEEGRDKTVLGWTESYYGVELTVDGLEKSFSQTPMSRKGGGSDSPLPEEKLTRIDWLLTHLPDDHGVLPPINRRLLIEVADNPQVRSRVFDLANAPAVVLELMRLLNASRSYVPEFPAMSSLHVRGFEHDGALAVSPQNEILFTGHPHRLQWWNPGTHEFVAEADVAYVRSVVFAPDKVHALVESSGDTVLIDLRERKPVRTFKNRFRPQFTQDGRRVLLYGSKVPVQILDTQSWEPIDQAGDLPKDFTSFIPAPSIHRALVRAADGTVALWDTRERRPIRQLRPESKQQMFACFSPDESLFALYVDPWWNDHDDGTPLMIFKSGNGEPVQELRRFETSGCLENIQSLLWTPDGSYVLAASGSSSGGSGVSVFSPATGRHRGELTGPVHINGMGLTEHSGELVVGDQYGNIFFWDLSVVMSHVREFESSLVPSPR